MYNKCNICNCKLSLFNKYNIVDGVICADCSRISQSYKENTIEELKDFWKINNERLLNFKSTSILKGLGATPIFIDTENKLFYIGKLDKKRKKIVYTFSEVTDYICDTIGDKTITKKKGTLKRAVIGNLIAGPVGAAIGASTAKEESKTIAGISVIHISFIMPSGLYKTTVAYPPKGFEEFLEKYI